MERDAAQVSARHFLEHMVHGGGTVMFRTPEDLHRSTRVPGDGQAPYGWPLASAGSGSTAMRALFGGG
ncbi:hypothetical protein OsI_17458 [Oryza sativa Indica Group]|uniref:Uncharacterized protein n=1 Tax=Oryza sativa subsp. indica TaxID=39946 RepID=B8AUG8_ORYSI|nr:hypothetical protein OsI_17458 [Oryza sativa Indica Group]